MKPVGGRWGCFGGGGSYGDWLCGVLAQILTGSASVKDYFDHVVGTSTGGLGSCALAYDGILKYIQLWMGLTTDKIYLTKDPSGIPFNEITDMALGQWKGMLNDAPLKEVIDKMVVGLPIIPATVCFCDMESGATFYATAFPDGTFRLESTMAQDYTYPASWFEQFKGCVLATASTEGGVDPVEINLAGGVVTGTTIPTPNVILQGMDGGPGALEPVDYVLDKMNGQGELICVTLQTSLKQYVGPRNLLGTIQRSVDILLQSQHSANMDRLVDCSKFTPMLNVVIFNRPELNIPLENSETFVPAVIQTYMADGKIAKPTFGMLLP